MADNITIKDGSGVSQVLRTKDNAGVQHPVHLLYGPDYNTLFPAAAALSDALSNPTVPMIGACALVYNPVSGQWEREEANAEGTLLASAASTTDRQSSNQTNHSYRGVQLYLNITVASGTGGLVPRIGAVDPVSGNVVYLNSDITPITTTGRYGLEIYPGASTTPPGGNGFMHQRVAASLGRTWLVRVIHQDTSSYTYSVGYSMIR